ncbi:hypothetical protein NE237_032306 [Protea cynaroides]|uniref:Reverse transcriptase Ty1/copia-type domain-containing protein n=1 Tax=Protea cynaroides TaxID=273540 RepID=A0A9Q0L345_9MAGN|nr:hypothetical protein NE237_032306 [Protea cynaroides]
MNRTLMERARCMLSNSGLEKDFWAEAVNTACYLVNRSPSTAIECKTPNEVWSDDMLIAAKNMSHIQVLKTQLSDEFEMKDLGATKKILGMEIQRDRKVEKLYLSQKSYIEKDMWDQMPQVKARSLVRRVMLGRGRIGSINGHDLLSHVAARGITTRSVATGIQISLHQLLQRVSNLVWQSVIIAPGTLAVKGE